MGEPAEVQDILVALVATGHVVPAMVPYTLSQIWLTVSLPELFVFVTVTV
jgi:hypothetical protein